MIDVNLAMHDWQTIAIESLALDLEFQKNPLSDAIGQEISFEDGALAAIGAAFRKFVKGIINFISEKGRKIGEFVQSKRYKTMGDRATAVNQYMAVKFNSASSMDVRSSFHRLYGSDQDFKNSVDRAIAGLDAYLTEPYGDTTNYLHDFQNNPSPIAISLKVASRAKLYQAPKVEKLLEIVNAVNKVTSETSKYTWDNFCIGDTKFENIDNLRFVLGDHSLFNDSKEEFDATAALVRGLFGSESHRIVEQTTDIYNPSKNTVYIKSIGPIMPKCIKSVNDSIQILKKIDSDYQRDFMAGRSDDTDRRLLDRVRSAVSMFAALTSYLQNIGRIISHIDGYNAALMTALKFVNIDYLRNHTKSRGLLGNGASELDTQAYSLLMNDDGVIEMALEHFGLHDVQKEMQGISDNYVKAVAIESRIQAYGVCIKDAAALEGMKPDCFNHAQLTDMFDFRPSKRNAEVALEITSILKSALFTVLVSLVIKYMNQIIEYIETKLSRARIERAIKTMATFKVTITKKVPTANQYNQQNSNIMDGLQKMRGVDKSGDSKPGGATHASTIKAQPMSKPVDDKPSLKRDLYKNVLVPLFGVDDNAAAGLASCTDVHDFLRFLNSVNVKGPMMFANDPINKTRKLVVLANTLVDQLHSISRGMDSIKKQLDSFIAGTRNEPYFVTQANGPMKAFLGDSDTEDVSQLSKAVKSEIAIYMRKNTLVGSALFRDPKVIQDTFKMLEGFKNEEAIRSLNKFTTDIKSVSNSAQASLDKFLKVETDPERKATVEAAVKKYVNELRDLAEALGSVVQAISKSVSYVESLANAANIFIEG